MFKLDNDFLTSLGLGSLPVDEKNKLLQHIYEKLEMNVGMRLAERMTEAQLDEFEGFIDRYDEAGALRWLETNFPNYKDVVAQELENIKREVSQYAPQILAASQQNVVSSPAQPGAAAQPAQFGAQPDMFNPSQPASPYQSPSEQPQVASQPFSQPAQFGAQPMTTGLGAMPPSQPTATPDPFMQSAPTAQPSVVPQQSFVPPSSFGSQPPATPPQPAPTTSPSFQTSAFGTQDTSLQQPAPAAFNQPAPPTSVDFPQPTQPLPGQSENNSQQPPIPEQQPPAGFPPAY